MSLGVNRNMFCPFCGNQVKNDSVFCAACGKKINIHTITEEEKSSAELPSVDLPSIELPSIEMPIEVSINEAPQPAAQPSYAPQPAAQPSYAPQSAAQPSYAPQSAAQPSYAPQPAAPQSAPQPAAQPSYAPQPAVQQPYAPQSAAQQPYAPQSAAQQTYAPQPTAQSFAPQPTAQPVSAMQSVAKQPFAPRPAAPRMPSIGVQIGGGRKRAGLTWLIVLAALVAIASALFFFFYESDEEKIQNRLDSFADACNDMDIQEIFYSFDKQTRMLYDTSIGITEGLVGGLIGFDLPIGDMIEFGGLELGGQFNIDIEVLTITVDDDEAAVEASITIDGKTETDTIYMCQEGSDWYIDYEATTGESIMGSMNSLYG